MTQKTKDEMNENADLIIETINTTQFRIIDTDFCDFGDDETYIIEIKDYDGNEIIFERKLDNKYVINNSFLDDNYVVFDDFDGAFELSFTELMRIINSA